MTTDIATGRIGNLSKEQELKIKQVWAHMLTHWGVPVDTKNVFQSRSNRGGESKSDADSNKNSKKGGKLFGKFLKGSGGSSKSGTSDQRDRSGSLGAKQTTEELETLFSGLEPSEVRENFWDMLRTDYPDNLLLRFLRARKWDTHKAMSMIAHTLRWRLKEAKPDEVIMGGELAAYKKNEKGYIKNIELSKATIRGFDNKGRPIVYVRPRLHHSSDQTEDEMKEYCLLIIEQTRLFLKEPVDCATILFDLTDFSMANMDYSPVQYLISCFEAHYPECLGHLFIHKAPWIFPPIWNIIKNWLDPVVASKIVFTKNTSDLVKYIPEKHIPASLGGDDKYDFDSFKKPDESVDAKLQDHETRNAIQEKRSAIIKSYIDTTVAWIESTAEKESSELLQRKIELSKQLSDNFRKLDPYIRSRSVYDINDDIAVRAVLNGIEKNVTQEGISVNILSAVIDFLCESTVLSDNTKLYVIENWLLPNNYYGNDVVRSILKHLGGEALPTLFKLRPPKTVQVALVKWLVHVYPLAARDEIFRETYEVWFQLWQYDFLQKWISYILVWSTIPDFVKPWRVRVVLDIATKSGYTNARALGTLLLRRYDALKSHKLIQEAIETINCNKRRLRTSSNEFINQDFCGSVGSVLDLNGRFNGSAYNSTMQDLLSLLSSTTKIDTPDVDVNDLSEIDTVYKLSKLIEKDRSVTDLEALIQNSNMPNMLFMTLLEEEHHLWKQINALFSLKMRFLSPQEDHNDKRVKILKSLRDFCQIRTSALQVAEEAVFGHLGSIPASISSRNSTSLELLTKPTRFKLYRRWFMNGIICARKARQPLKVFNSGLQKLLFAINFWSASESGKFAIHESTLEVLVNLQISELRLNGHLFCDDNTLRLILRTMNLTLVRVLEPNWEHVMHFTKVFIPRCFLSGDPVATGFSLLFLLKCQQACQNWTVPSFFNAMLRQHTEDCANYLWNTGKTRKRSLFAIPVSFIRNFDARFERLQETASRHIWLGITNVPSTSFSSFLVLRRAEQATHCKKCFTGPFTSQAFKRFRRKTDGHLWMKNIDTFLKLQIFLLSLMQNDPILYPFYLFLVDNERGLSLDVLKISAN